MLRRLGRLVAHPFFSLVVVLAFTQALVVVERDLSTMTFVLCTFWALVGAILLASGRFAFSVALGATLYGTLVAISEAKRAYMGTSLLAFDTVFFRPGSEVYEFLLTHYLRPAFPALAVLVAGTLLALVSLRHEPLRRHARIGGAAMTAAAVAGAVATFPAGAKSHHYYIGEHAASSFFASLPNAREIGANMVLFKNLAFRPDAGAFSGRTDCAAHPDRPDIVAVLMESLFPPNLFPDVKAPPEIVDGFRWPDGRIRHLQVEVFANGTWVTTAGLLTSLPMADFGGSAVYLPVYLTGRVHHSLPSVLKACGYKTVHVTALSRTFANEGLFLSSLPFDEIVELGGRFPSGWETRDASYFDAVADYIADHRRRDARPLFITMETLSTHGPYRTRRFPDIAVPGEPFGNEPAMDEYLRRVAILQSDFAAFRTRIEGGTAGTVLLEYGDHHPSITLGRIEQREGPRALTRGDSIGYRTYYRLHGLGRPLAGAPPEVPSLAIGFLAPTLLEAAGLPLDDVYRDLAAFRDACLGRLYRCPDRARLEDHIARRVNGGLLDVGGGPSARGSGVTARR